GAAAINEIAVTVLATIDGATVTATGLVNVGATMSSEISGTATGFSGAFSGGGGLGASLGAAGSGTRNSVANTVEASIRNSTINTSAAVQVTATNSASIKAYAGALAIAFGLAGGSGLGLAVGVSFAVNQVGAVTINGVLRNHTTSALIVSSTIGSGGSPAGPITVSATTNGTIASLSFAGSGAVGGGAGAGVAASGAGAGSSNTIVSTTEARIAGSSNLTSAGAVTVSASDSATIHAEAGSAALAAGIGGGFGGSITVGAANAENVIGLTVTAAIDGSTVDTSGLVTVSATSSALIDAVAIGMAAALSGGTGAGVALSGAGSAATNTIANTVEARIRTGAITTSGFDVLVWAKDSSTITAVAGAAAASITGGGGGGLGVAVGASFSANKIGDPSGCVTLAGACRAHAIRAVVDTTSVVGTALDPVGKLTVKAESTGVINALTYAGAAAAAFAGGGAAAAAGAGAVSENFINGTTEAKIANSIVMTKAGAPVEVLATNSSTIKAQAGAAAVATGVAFGGGGAITMGAGVSDNEIGNTIRATIQAATVTAGDEVRVEARSTATIHSVAIGVAASVAGGVFVGIALSGAGSATTNQINNTVEATVTGASSVTSANGKPITILGEDTSDIGSFAGALAVAVGVAIGGAGAAVGVSVSTNDIGSTARAKIDDSSAVAAGSLTVEARSTGHIRSHAVAGAFGGGTGGALGVGGAISVNNIHTMVEAIVSNADAASSQEVKGTAVAVKATNTADIIANALGLAVSVSIGASFSISFVRAENTITTATTAKVDNSKVTGTTGAVEVLATSTGSIVATPMAAAIANSGAGAAAGGGVRAQNSITPATTATIVGSSSVTAATSVKVEAKDTSSIRAEIITVAAAASLGAIAVGLALADNTIGGTITGSTAGSSVTASNGDINVLASANQAVVTYSVVLAAAFGAIGASGAAARTDEKIQPNVTASVSGGTLTATGHVVNIHGSFIGNADPETTAGSVTISLGGGAVSLVKADALIAGTTSAFAAGGTISANGLDVKATDQSTVTAYAKSSGISTGLSISGVIANASVTRTTQAYVGAGTLNTNGGPLTVHATSTSTNELDGDSIAAGAAAIGGVTLDAKDATTTQAYVGDGALVQAGVVDLKAHATNTVSATSLNISIALLAAGALTLMQATDDSQVSAWIGPPTGTTSGGTAASVIATGNVTVAAQLDSTVTSESKLGSISLGGSIGIIKARAINTADVLSYLGHAAGITATGFTVSFTGTHHGRAQASGFGIAAAGLYAGAGVLVEAEMTP
ncbi:MAG TPA: hypothetical protein VFX65_07310, partial [Candidatus Limnocylindrales bacterium]|nr:hypothetical protein [Candidatus Limnocylindrales bacterium]